MPKTRAIRVRSRDGEVHLILQDSILAERKEHARDFGQVEIRRIMRREVSKPLLLLRSE
jgi:hypothetical protein